MGDHPYETYRRLFQLSETNGKVVHGMNNVLVYIDDLLLHSETHEQHLHSLDQLLRRLEAHHIKMNMEKRILGAKE